MTTTRRSTRSAAPPIDNILDFTRPLPRGPDRRPATELPLARADPRRGLPPRPLQRPGPARGPGRGRQAAPGASERRRRRRRSGSRRSPRARRRPTGSRPRSGGGSRPAPRRATTPSSSAPTATRTPILRALNMAGIPWRFSGTSGLYARPEVRLLLAFLRVVADLESSVDLYALAASDVYGLGGEDLTAIVNMARRRNRSVWAILEELDRQPGILRVSPDDADDRRTGSSTDLRALRRAVAHERPAGELLYRFLRGSGHARPARRRRTRRPPRRRSRTSPASSRSSAPSRRCSPTTARSSSRRHLATLIEAGDDPATAELDPGRRRGRGPDRPQGQGPRVPGRLPARAWSPAASRRAAAATRWPCRPASVAASRRRRRLALAEERRLCYVAMTRARDELILSHAADYGGARARRVSPFVLEALDLPVAAGDPGRRRARPPRRSSAWPRSTRRRRAASAPRRADHRAAVAELLPGRRLPDLPAQVQVRPRPARPARAAPRDHLRRGPPQGGPAVPPPARHAARS